MSSVSGGSLQISREITLQRFVSYLEYTSLNTGESAKLLGVSQQTIIRACDSGLLHSFKVPGSSHRRILPQDLIAYAIKFGMPLAVLAKLANEIPVLLLGAEETELPTGFDELISQCGFSMKTTACGFEFSALASAHVRLFSVIIFTDAKLHEPMAMRLMELADQGAIAPLLVIDATEREKSPLLNEVSDSSKSIVVRPVLFHSTKALEAVIELVRR